MICDDLEGPILRAFGTKRCKKSVWKKCSKSRPIPTHPGMTYFHKGDTRCYPNWWLKCLKFVCLLCLIFADDDVDPILVARLPLPQCFWKYVFDKDYLSYVFESCGKVAMNN